MVRFIARRILQFPLVLAIIYLVTFMLCWVAPGDPFSRTDRNISPEVRHALETKYHMDHWYKFLAWYPYNAIVHRDLGPSLTNASVSVNDIIRQQLPISLEIGVAALAIATLGGVCIGTLAAVRRDGVIDWASLMVALAGISIPSFVAASVLIAAFAVRFKIFPADGWQPHRFSDMVLPSFALSLMPMAYLARLTRVSMIDILGSDYVRTARAKGLSRTKVIWKHALRNALLPVLSYLGPAAATTLVGSFVIEKVFNIPGLGGVFVDSVQNRDQTLILGSVMVESALLLAMNLVVDIGYGFLDPRIEVGS
jgi:ABC-type dipeptide/oligopeptide/nickel transport system permease component